MTWLGHPRTHEPPSISYLSYPAFISISCIVKAKLLKPHPDSSTTVPEAMSELAKLAEALAWLARRGQLGRLERSYWGKLLDLEWGRSGVRKLSQGEAKLELVKLGAPYGYLRLDAGSCKVEGVLVYRQKYIVFKPQRVEGCSELEPQKLPGIEPYEEEEE